MTSRFSFARFRSQAGQGTIEYILMTSLVIGVVLTIFNGPLKKFLNEYTSRKTQYTQVVSQNKLGIPMGWFGGNFKNPGNGSGGATAGGDNAGNASDSSAPDTTAGSTPGGNSPNGGANAGGNNAGGDNAGGNNAGGKGAGGGGGSGGGSNNNLLGSNSQNGTNSRTGGKGGTNSGKDNESDEETGGTGGTGGGNRAKDNKGDGRLQSDQTSSGEENGKGTKIKGVEDGETLKAERTLYGSIRERVHEGNCGNMDLKTIIQIAFVLGLLFLLASILFQKRGGDD